MKLQVPTPPHFDKVGAPTPEFRHFIELAIKDKATQENEVTNLERIETLVSEIEGLLLKKQEIEFEEYLIKGTHRIFYVDHGFKTKEIGISLFNDGTTRSLVYSIEATAKQIRIEFLHEEEATNLHVRLWGLKQK